MPKVKLLQDYKSHKQGEIITLTPNEAHGLIDDGKAEIVKLITRSDYKVKHGHST
jgi:quercetin dioxygenase-like cupin family protein